MNSAFDPDALDDAFAFVDDCSPAWLDRIVDLPLGGLQERVRGCGAWHQALLAGTMPPVGSWPGPTVDGPVRAALEELQILCFCREQPSLVDALLADILDAFERSAQAFEQAVHEKLRELEALERSRAAAQEEAARRPPHELAQLAHALACDARAGGVEADGAMVVAWRPLVRAWTDIAAVFGDLGELLGAGRDLSLGVLRHTGWQELLRLHALAAQLPQLRDLVRELGRLQDDTTMPSVTETVFEPMRRIAEEQRQVPAPLVPADVRGVERGDSLSRMLPSEALMLAHPALKLLWHARRAERALLTYRVEGSISETILAEREETTARERRAPRQTRGPIIAVIDTSGSMRGLPEQLAKALVLEALRTAHAERRRCLLLAFGGPGELAETALSLDEEGLGRLLAFLGMSFSAGTDPSAMLGRVLEKLRTPAWARADVLVASDGEWSLDAQLRKSAQEVREHGTRFHGMQIGNSGRTGLHLLCDPVHESGRWMASRPASK